MMRRLAPLLLLAAPLLMGADAAGVTFTLGEVAELCTAGAAALAALFWRLWASQAAAHASSMNQVHARLDDKRKKLDEQDQRLRLLEQNGGLAVQRMTGDIEKLQSLVMKLSEQVAILLDRQRQTRRDDEDEHHRGFGKAKTDPGRG